MNTAIEQDFHTANATASHPPSTKCNNNNNNNNKYGMSTNNSREDTSWDDTASTHSCKESDYAEICSLPARSSIERLFDTLFTAGATHYLLWAPLAMALIYLVASIVWKTLGSTAAWTVLVLPILAYLPSYLSKPEFTGPGRSWPLFRLSSLWLRAHRYLNLTIIRTTKLEPGKQFIFGWHPHGIQILSRFSMLGGQFEQLFPGIMTTVLVASPIFKYPGAREVNLWAGSIDADRKYAEEALETGASLIIYPGGSAEIFLTEHKTLDTTLVLKDRKGFIQLAIKYGLPLVPVVVFNERKAYTKLDPPQWLIKYFLKHLRLPVLAFYGRWGTLLPRAGINLGVVFGAPITVPHIPSVSKTDYVVAQTAELYQKHLKELWEKHKKRFGYTDDDRLVIH